MLSNKLQKHQPPKMSIQKKSKAQIAEGIRMLDHGEKAMIAKFYHNQPKSPNRQE